MQEPFAAGDGPVALLDRLFTLNDDCLPSLHDGVSANQRAGRTRRDDAATTVPYLERGAAIRTSVTQDVRQDDRRIIVICDEILSADNARWISEEHAIGAHGEALCSGGSL